MLTSSSVPHPVLRQKFDEINEVLLGIIQAMAENASITRHCIACVASLLISQDAAVWSSDAANDWFSWLLTKLIDERPKVRKHAQVALNNVMSHPPPPTVTHPATTKFSKFILSILKADSNDQSYQVIEFLSEQWRHVIPAQVAGIAQSLLNMRTANPASNEINKIVFQCLSSLMMLWNHSQDQFSFPADKLSPILQSIMTLRPNVNDAVVLPLWLSCAVNGTCAMWTADREVFHPRITSVFAKIFDLFQYTPHSKQQTSAVHEALEASIKTLLNHVLDLQLVKESCDASLILVTDRTSTTPLEAIISKIGTGLSLTYQSGWSSVLVIIADTLNTLRKFHADAPFELMKNILQVLADDDVYAQNEHYPHKEKLMLVLGAAIRCLSISQLTSIIPLNILDSLPQRLWMLALLKDYVVNSELGYFLNTLVPISHQVSQKSKEFKEKGEMLESQSCAIVWRQIWDTLPAFCLAPSDLHQFLQPVVTMLKSLLISNESLGASVCESLRNLVTSNREVIKESQREICTFKYTISAEQAQSNLDFMASYAGELFPTLFAKFVDLTVSSAGVQDKSNPLPMQLKVQILETIKVWISISRQQKVNEFFMMTFNQFLSSKSADPSTDGSTIHKTNSNIDLINAFTQSMRLEKNAVALMYRVVSIGLMEKTDATLQKKSYKALCMLHQYCFVETSDDTDESLIARSALVREAFWDNNAWVLDVLTKIMNPDVAPGAATRKDRLTLITYLVKRLSWDTESTVQDSNMKKMLAFIPSMLTETILATKEVNEKARLAAYDLLISIARQVANIETSSGGQAKMAASGDADDEEELTVGLNEIFKMSLAGLAGKTAHMISASIHSLSRLIFEFRPSEYKQVDSNLLETIIQSVLLYAQASKNREVIKASIGFLKVIVVVMPQLLTQEQDSMYEDEKFDYVSAIVQTAVKWSSEHKSHFRVPCRYLIERLVRKAGYDAVAKSFPQEQHKLLTNVRKRGERAERKKEAKAEGKKSSSFEALVNDEESDNQKDQSEDGDELPQMLQELVADVSARKGGKKFESLRIRESTKDDTEPVDFLDRKTVGRVRDQQKKRTFDCNATRTSYEQDESGRYIVQDSDEDVTETVMQAGQGSYLEAKTSKDSFTYSGDGKRLKFNNKRSRDDADDDAADSTLTKSVLKSKKLSIERERQHAGIKHTGKEFRTKKAKGDVKRAGKHEPYAYIPLNPKIVATGKGKKKSVQLNKKLLDI